MERNSICWGKKSLIAFILAVLCLVAVVLILVFFLPEKGCPSVNTTCGKVKGVCSATKTNRTIHEFFYIPYAVPPIGNRRWTHSETLFGVHCWNGTYDATSNGTKRCTQRLKSEKKGDENCLYLSVRTPNVRGNLPVLVWFHGGSLLSGYADEVGYSVDKELTSELNAVTVNVNYRLGALGFLSLPELWEDGKSYGNFGFGDALTALKWVRENIKQFGGNTENVTIMGESSGATIVLGLVISPKARGLFSSAISLSAVPMWKATYQTAFQGNNDFAERAGCSDKDYETSKDLRACLKNSSTDTILKATDYNRGWGFYDFPFSHGKEGESMDYNIIEPTIIPFPPQELKDHKNVANRSINVIIGNTAQEVGYNAFIYKINIIKNWTSMEELLKSRLSSLKLPAHLETLKELYNFGNSSNTWWPQLAWDTMVSDIRATCPLNTMNQEMDKSARHTMYRLYIEHRPSSSVGENWDAFHGWDTEALFDFKYFNFNTSDHDEYLRRSMIKLVNDTIHNKLAAYNGRSIYMRNSAPWYEINDDVPQQNVCSETDKLGYAQWAWQN